MPGVGKRRGHHDINAGHIGTNVEKSELKSANAFRKSVF
jgi:hypothetical protein